MLAPLERRRQARNHTVVGVALYALFLVTAPFEHHDLVCHLKTPTHCTACTSSLLGSDPHTPGAVGAADLAYAGGAFALDVVVDGCLLTVRSTGRSPPAAV
jgi:hypothetical protein